MIQRKMKTTQVYNITQIGNENNVQNGLQSIMALTIWRNEHFPGYDTAVPSF